MAKPSASLVVALRQTADRLSLGGRYQWTHQGACNCGHLVQTVTQYSPAKIHAMALQKQGDWAEKAMDYCPGSRYPIDHIITTLLGLGLSQGDIVHLERLSDPKILRRWPCDQAKPLRHRREDVVTYVTLWAELLEEEMQLEGPQRAKTPVPKPNVSEQSAAEAQFSKV